MKKLLALIICLLIVTSNMVAVAYNEKYEDAIFRTTALGLFQGYENNEMAPDKNITRAEFATVAIRLMGVDNANLVNKSVFSDVSEGHWACGSIFYAKALGLIEGFSDNTFRPDDNITRKDALKVLVCALGYRYLAEQSGGYPTGYIYEAARLGISKNTQPDVDSHATRGDIAIYVDNALEVPLMEQSIGEGDEKYTIDKNNTLLNKIMDRKSIVEYEGVLSENEVTSLEGETTSNKGYVKIDDKIFMAGETDIGKCLGQRVKVFAFDDDNENYPIVQYYKVHKKNNQITINAEQVISIDINSLKYENNNKISEIKLDGANAYYIYNNKAIPREQVTVNDLIIFNGHYRLVDFSSDGTYDVIFIEERESFVINGINNTNYSVYFDNNDNFRGQNGLKYKMDEDDYHYFFYDKDGNEKSFEDLKEGMVITIVASKDMEYVTTYLSDEFIDGTVDEVNFTQNEIMIDGNVYKLSKNVKGEVSLDVNVGDSRRYLLDAFGEIANVDFNVESTDKYAYVIDAMADSGLSKSLKIKIVEKGESYKEVEQKGNTEYTYYYYQNEKANVYELADRVVLNDVNTSANKINPSYLINKIIKYSLNDEGRVFKADVFDLGDAAKQNFNADIQSFGGYFNVDGFLIGKGTKVICIPKIADSEEDYYQKIKLVNGTNYEVCAVDVDSRTQIAGAVAIYENMDADSPASIEADADICIVGGLSEVIVDDEYYYKIEMLNGDEKEVRLARRDGFLEGLLKELKSGSLMKYSTDAYGVINNIDVLATVSDLNKYYRANSNAPDEEVYGIVYDIKINRLSNIRNAMVDNIDIVFNKEGSGTVVNYDILRKNGPKIYVYNRKLNRITSGTTDEISSYLQVGADASEVFMLVNNNNPEVLVIIKR